MREVFNYSKGGTMTTNMGVEFDGKTHGPATNMAQLGIERGAYRSGVLRTPYTDKNLRRLLYSY